MISPVLEKAAVSRRGTQPDFRLEGRVALVTGAGSGTGRAIAVEYARAGAQVVLVARTRASLDEAAAVIAASGGRAIVSPCDVTDTDAIRALIAGLGVLDILVNNAGTNIPQPFIEVADENLDALIGLNMRATYLVAQACVRKMMDHPHRKRIGGAILNITSQMGHVGSPNRTLYCMTKHGVEGLTKAMAVELATQGIRVNSIAPTFVDTPLIRRIVDTPDKRNFLQSRIPLGRMASEREIALAAVYLASDAAAMVSGTSLVVDGGWTAQ